MQILLNELSLTGQFSTTSFMETGLLPFIRVLTETQAFPIALLLKKSALWNQKVTSDSTLHELLISPQYRRSDEFRRFKSAIDLLTREPFWDTDTRQDSTASYLAAPSCTLTISGSSIAEACERDQILVSFLESPTSANPLEVTKNGTPIQLLNLTQVGELTQHLWNEERISFAAYVKSKFSGGKLQFLKVDPQWGFETVQNDKQDLFITAFEKFNELTWEQILKDNGLNYKQYNNSFSRDYKGKTTYKFRVSGAMRCHGYREKDNFIVIGFETDHSLSDKG
jgi:hypothetical protein